MLGTRGMQKPEAMLASGQTHASFNCNSLLFFVYDKSFKPLFVPHFQHLDDIRAVYVLPTASDELNSMRLWVENGYRFHGRARTHK